MTVVVTVEDLEDLLVRVRDGERGHIRVNGEVTNIYVQEDVNADS